MSRSFRFSAILDLFLCMALAIVAVAAVAKDAPGLADAKTAFAKADRELNEAWAAVKKALPAEKFSELKEVQRELRSDGIPQSRDQRGRWNGWDLERFKQNRSRR